MREISLAIAVPPDDLLSMRHVFTKENAREMSRRGNLARWSRPSKPLVPSIANPVVAETEAEKVLRAQIELLDGHISKAKKAEDICKLIAAKEKLWRLLHPADMPPNGRTGSRAPVLPIPRATPQPIAPTSPLVVSTPEENHKSETAPAQVAA